jgi:hypothetical protein
MSEVTVNEDAEHEQEWLRRDPKQVQEWLRSRMTRSVVVELARVVAQLCAFVGVVAGFWHIQWIAGVGMLASGLVAVGVHSAGYVRLELDQEPPPQDVEEPGDTES